MTHVITSDGRIVELSGSHQYTGEKTGGELASWLTHTPDPHEFIRYSYGRLAACNATLYNTSALARACVKKPASYVIGDGLYFRSAIHGDFLGLSKEKAKNWSRKFSDLLHREKIALGYYEKQTLLYQEAKITGDSFLYFLREDSEDSEDNEDNELDLIPTGGHDIDWEKSIPNQVILGIKVDSFGRRQGVYRINGSYVPFRDSDGNQNLVQLLFRERAGQIRGYGCFYSEIARAKNIDRVWDATIARMAQEAINIGSFTVDSSDPMRGAIGVVAAVYDTSEAERAQGVKRYIITNTDSKAKRPNLATTEGMTVAQEEVDEIYGVLESRIVDARNIDKSVIRMLGGRTITARRGKKLGLIDGIREKEEIFMTEAERVELATVLSREKDN